MAAAGFQVWQFLPLHPPDANGSPYASSSAFAGDVRLIDPRLLLRWGWIPPAGVAAVTDDPHIPQTVTDALLGMALEHLERHDGRALADFHTFCLGQAHWLEDFALFTVIRQMEQDKPWWEWSREWQQRDPCRLADLRIEADTALQGVRFAQFVFFRQWAALRARAQARGILLLGDMPIFVAQDSVDVWAHRAYFDLEDDGRPRTVAGVPPDYFSATGQRWGNPHYHWDRLAADQHGWWVRRIRWALANLDGLRIDHFRGFEAYWEIPSTEATAMHGRWVTGPGAEFFTLLREKLGRLPMLAEDLGIITPAVTALREQFALPGMKILQFAFDGSPDNPYLPAHHVEEGVVYTGTHDNDTSVGWFAGLTVEQQSWVLSLLRSVPPPAGTSVNPGAAGVTEVAGEVAGVDHPPEFTEAAPLPPGFAGPEWLSQATMPWPMLWAALASPARLSVIPMQDALGLDGQHRMNVPGTQDGNWRWRFRWEDVPVERAAELRALHRVTGRLDTGAGEGVAPGKGES